MTTQLFLNKDISILSSKCHQIDAKPLIINDYI